MKTAKVTAVRLWGTGGNLDGPYVYNVDYEYDGSCVMGSIAAKDELDAWRKFQDRLDEEIRAINAKLGATNVYG